MVSCIKHKWAGLFLKLDFQEAFDYVDWSFLLKTLEAKEFGQKWCQWVATCTTTGTSLILANRQLGGHMRRRRGLRQGVPLSFYLFILVVDALSKILQNAALSGLLAQVGSIPPHLCCLQYVNDTFILTPTDTSSLINL